MTPRSPRGAVRQAGSRLHVLAAALAPRRDAGASDRVLAATFWRSPAPRMSDAHAVIVPLFPRSRTT
jgi:hypothetical protein